ncbi:MarR family transcriptional regulator [Sporolactobacillus shoreicorticis]|uniref:MarR family winged helix-turn-helix transcriptional regulator n=1 Tax=Sporolactobacillus shoreicorticis TaxID=1923877 RepID=A0ABW5S2H7_9BACL|nr:MarR family transcriptional regulator [Sporolactobacillus shoreicorticis]MCO7127084.1 MarR family transcriptional regulator [Sporolactobacillus shoreicorticis]
MFQEHLSVIANYLWKQSVIELNRTLSESEVRHFNMNDYYYLTIIYQMETPNLGKLAEELQLTKPAISAIVKRLTEKGFVEKKRSTEDKRIYHLKVTDKGRRIIENDYKSFKDLENLLAETISKDQLNVLKQIFDQVVDRLKENKAKV